MPPLPAAGGPNGVTLYNINLCLSVLSVFICVCFSVFAFTNYMFISVYQFLPCSSVCVLLFLLLRIHELTILRPAIHLFNFYTPRRNLARSHRRISLFRKKACRCVKNPLRSFVPVRLFSYLSFTSHYKSYFLVFNNSCI